MEYTPMKIIIILLIIGILFLVGCETNTQQPQTTEQQPYVGGGCGVSPVEDTGNINQLPINAMM